MLSGNVIDSRYPDPDPDPDCDEVRGVVLEAKARNKSDFLLKCAHLLFVFGVPLVATDRIGRYGT